MKITGIICEYNPFHLGHKKQFDVIRQMQGADSGIVCLMSGSYVQRGAPAILNKRLRAEAAIRCGADLVLELPVTYSLRSAEGFADGGVAILSGFCTHLCFGVETPDKEALLSTAKALLSPSFSDALRTQLTLGLSFPAARQAALEELGFSGNLLLQPNNILAVEYCKAILRQHSSLEPLPIFRDGNYHDAVPHPENPSATALRTCMTTGTDWQSYLPSEATQVFEGASIHTLQAGERAILARLRCMTDAEFEALPFGSEGLWRKLMHAARRESTLEQILTATKSKRYTRTRLDRMVMCAYLGISQELLDAPAPYARVLALNETGRSILKQARTTGLFPNTGAPVEHPYQQLEHRCEDLYGLFADNTPDAPGAANTNRIFLFKKGAISYENL